MTERSCPMHCTHSTSYGLQCIKKNVMAIAIVYGVPVIAG